MNMDGSVTLREWKREQWGYLKSTVTAGTVRAYSAAWNRRLEPTLGDSSLSDVDAFVIESAWELWSGSRSTKGDALALLSRLMGRAMRGKLIAENPVRQIEIGRDEKPDPVARALEPAEFVRLLMRVQAGPYRRLLQTLGYSGLRFGEAAGLIVRDVDLEQGLIHVRRAASLDDQGRLEQASRRPKSHGVRAVPILEQLRSVLAEATRAKGDLNLVFPGPRGGTLTSKNVSRAIGWSDWRDEIRSFPVGENPLRFHDMRHSAVTFYLRAGVPVHEVQRIMGHSSIQVTELYAHSDTERIRMAGEKLSDYLKLQGDRGVRAA